VPAEEQNTEQRTGESTPITKKPRVAAPEGRRSPTMLENKEDMDTEAEEAEDFLASDDEVVVSDEEPEEDEAEGLEDAELDRELDEQRTAEEDDALDDGNISD
jgi:hypothetical protein